MSARLLPLLFLLFSLNAQGQQYKIQHCYLGCPQGAADSNPLLMRAIYTLSYNTQLKTAEWVAYEVHPGAIGIASSLSRQPLEDNYVSDTLKAADFLAGEEQGLARAQYVPLVSFADTPYWNEVNYLTNAVARSSSLSQGAWYGLDWAIRNLVNREDSVFVVAGPIFYADSVPVELDTSTSHRVPDAFFKVVIDDNNRAAAFLFPQGTAVHVHHCELASSIEEIESLSGLNLFPDSDDNIAMTLSRGLGCS